MPKSLQRPVVLLTGASSGIGYDVAPLLVRYGYTVYGAARRVEKIEELASEGVKALSLDVTDEASMEAAVQQIIDAEGRIDVLINNAGYGSYGAIEDVPIDEARHQFEVNLFGLARLTQLVLPHMRYDVLRDGKVAPAPEVYAGVRADECAQLMVDFFKERRP